MKFITASNARFREEAISWKENMTALGMDHEIYDLHGLGFGKKFYEENKNFHDNGFYIDLLGVWKSKALFKPFVLWDAIHSISEFETLIWTDVNAQLIQPFSLEMSSYDIGVVQRATHITSKIPFVNLLRGNYNAGVIVFRRTPATISFIKQWCGLTEKVQNDQLALNTLLKCTKGLRIKELESIYNDDEVSPDTLITHIKGEKKCLNCILQ